MKFRRRLRPDPSINLTSLIDILFIVLVFLVLTTTFREAAQFRVDLPQAATGERSQTDVPGMIRVTVARDGGLFVSQRSVSLDELREMFVAASATSDAQILLAADARAEHGRVVSVMDLARRAGVARLSIETRPTDDPGPRGPG